MFGGHNDAVFGGQGSTVPTQPEGTLNGVDDLANNASAPAPASGATTFSSNGDAYAATSGAPAQPGADMGVSQPVQQPVDMTVPGASGAPVGDDDLLDLKQQALQQLSPLLGHLDQTPEERFRTTMMLIQASDNQALLKDAYAAAQQISDEKTRAQALLDVVNEINYFTQPKPQEEDEA